MQIDVDVKDDANDAEGKNEHTRYYHDGIMKPDGQVVQKCIKH